MLPYHYPYNIKTRLQNPYRSHPDRRRHKPQPAPHHDRSQQETRSRRHPSHEEDHCQPAASTSCSIVLLAIVIVAIAILLEHRAQLLGNRPSAAALINTPILLNLVSYPINSLDHYLIEDRSEPQKFIAASQTIHIPRVRNFMHPFDLSVIVRMHSRLTSPNTLLWSN